MNWHWLRHQWTKWEQYTQKGTDYGSGLRRQEPVPFTQRRQRRHCEICNKEQDEAVDH